MVRGARGGDKAWGMASVDRFGGGARQCGSDERTGDKEFVMEEVNEDGAALEFASDELRGDKEVVMAAVKKGSEVPASLLSWTRCARI